MRQHNISFLGIPGSNSELAVEEFSAKSYLPLKAVPAKNIGTLFESIKKHTKLGIIPIENSTAGPVIEALDLLLKNNMWIIGEHYLSVKHNFIGWENDELDLEGKIVHSHPQAINQCKNFISERRLRAELADDTASAVKYVSTLRGREKYNNFGIANRRAAEIYKLKILKESIEDNKDNTTRFLIVQPINAESPCATQPYDRLKEMKMTVSYEILPHLLWKVLKKVHEEGLWTSTIHSRPTKCKEGSKNIFNRVFYSDIVSRKFEKPRDLRSIMSGIESSVKGCKINILGFYLSGDMKYEPFSERQVRNGPNRPPYLHVW